MAAMCLLGVFASRTSMAQTVIPLENRGFETNTLGGVFAVKISSGFDAADPNDVAGWRDVGSGNNADGVDYAGDNGLTVHSGTVCAWSQGGKPGAFQTTSYQIHADDAITLTWWAKCTYGPSGNADQLVQLLVATNTTDVFSNLTTLAVSSAPLNNTGNGGAYTGYTLTYITQPADVGKYVAVSFKSPTGGNRYAAFDDFELSVQANQNLPALGACYVNPNPCYALSQVTLTNVDTGTSINPIYQWQTNSDLSGNELGTWDDISGATSLQTSIAPPDVDPGGTNYTLSIRLVANSSGGSVTSAPAVLVVMPASSPQLTVDTTPSSAAIDAGGTASFSVTFVGTIPIAYQWQTDAAEPGTFVNIAGGTNSTLNLVAPYAGNYQLVASNVVGTSTSTPASLTVNPVYFANLLVNGSFEKDITGSVFNAKVANGFDVSGKDVAGWLNSGTNYGDSGVDFAGNNGLTVADGKMTAYLHLGDSGAYQICQYPLQAGDQFTLTWSAKSLYLAAAQQVQLLIATNTADSFSNLTSVATSTETLYYNGNGAAYYQYTLAYTATEADAGKYLAVSFINTGGAGNSYAAFDDFHLTVLQTNPTLDLNSLVGGNLKLNWVDGVLLEATNILGPWTTNIYALPPLTVTPTEPMKFYRTQLP